MPDPSEKPDGVDPESKPEDKPDDKPQVGNVDELPPWARDALTKANKEAADYRTKLREAEPLAKKAREIEESQKTESQKLTDRATAAEQDRDASRLETTRLLVALEQAPDDMPAKRVAQLAKRLTGATREELEADAVELFAEFAGSSKPNGGAPAGGKPRENLRGGGDPDDAPEETDPAKLAALVGRTNRF